MTLGDYIKEYRTSNDLSMDEFSQKSGMSKAYISILERNYNPSTKRAAVPSIETIKRVAVATGTDFNDLIAAIDQEVSLIQNKNDHKEIPSGFQPMPEMVLIPRVGRIACGEPITAEENIEGYDKASRQWKADFSLVCVGDSMEPKIQDGDIVAIRIQPEVTNGEIAAVRIEDEATLKQVFLHPDYIELRPLNPAYQSIIKIGEQMNDVHIEGKAVGLCRDL